MIKLIKIIVVSAIIILNSTEAKSYEKGDTRLTISTGALQASRDPIVNLDYGLSLDVAFDKVVSSEAAIGIQLGLKQFDTKSFDNNVVRAYHISTYIEVYAGNRNFTSFIKLGFGYNVYGVDSSVTLVEGLSEKFSGPGIILDLGIERPISRKATLFVEGGVVSATRNVHREIAFGRIGIGLRFKLNN